MSSKHHSKNLFFLMITSQQFTQVLRSKLIQIKTNITHTPTFLPSNATNTQNTSSQIANTNPQPLSESRVFVRPPILLRSLKFKRRLWAHVANKTLPRWDNRTHVSGRGPEKNTKKVPQSTKKGFAKQTIIKRGIAKVRSGQWGEGNRRTRGTPVRAPTGRGNSRLLRVYEGYALWYKRVARKM